MSTCCNQCIALVRIACPVVGRRTSELTAYISARFAFPETNSARSLFVQCHERVFHHPHKHREHHTTQPRPCIHPPRIHAHKHTHTSSAMMKSSLVLIKLGQLWIAFFVIFQRRRFDQRVLKTTTHTLASWLSVADAGHVHRKGVGLGFGGITVARLFSVSLAALGVLCFQVFDALLEHWIITGRLIGGSHHRQMTFQHPFARGRHKVCCTRWHPSGVQFVIQRYDAFQLLRLVFQHRGAVVRHGLGWADGSVVTPHKHGVPG